MPEPRDSNDTDAPELAPNMWFAEYGMPYTTAILEAEAEANREHPGSRGEERHELAQFLIDQETAVVRDYLEGRISQEEFEDFKSLGEKELQDLRDRAETEVEELEEDFEDWGETLNVEVQAFAEEHGAEVTNLVETSQVRELTSQDLSLHMASDLLGLGVNAVDDALERLPPHIHDLLDVVEEETLDSAHKMLDARAELSSADAHDLAGERETLEGVEETFETEIHEAHEDVDTAFERMDQELEHAKETVATAQQHAELDPAATIEQMPYKTIEADEVQEQIEDETGVTDA